MIPSDMALQQRNNKRKTNITTFIEIENHRLEIGVPLIGGFLLVACDVFFAPPPDVTLNNKIANITVNTNRATIKYFSNLVRVRQSVILCMQETKRKR